jgi:hypothetical protein
MSSAVVVMAVAPCAFNGGFVIAFCKCRGQDGATGRQDRTSGGVRRVPVLALECCVLSLSQPQVKQRRDVVYGSQKI